jgi:ATP-binding cassette, subfamily C, bacterial
MLQLLQLFQRLRLRWLRNQRIKTPTLLQIEVAECGAAALGIILAYYGRVVPLAELRIECGVSRNGSTAGNIVKAARRYGLIAKGYKQELDQLIFLSPPYIVFWNFNHFLVVESFSRQRVYLNDPAGGRRHVSLQEFDEGFTGVVLTFEPGENFERKGRQPSVISALSNHLYGSRRSILACISVGFLLVIPGIILPVLSQLWIDHILVENRLNWLSSLTIAFTVALCLQGVLLFWQLRLFRKLKLALSQRISRQILWHLLRLPVEFYAQRFAGEVSDRIQIANEVAEIVSGQLATTVISTMMLLFYAGVMFSYDVLLTIIGLTFAGANLLALQLINRQRVDTNARMMQDHGKAGGVAIAGLQNIETIKAAGAESDLFARWAGYNAKVINAQQSLESINQSLSVLPIFLHATATLLVLVIGGLRVMEGTLTIGMLIAFQSLMNSLLEPVHQLVDFGSTLQELSGNLKRLDDILQNPIDPELSNDDSPISDNNRANTEILPCQQLHGQVELREVTFGYSHVDPPLIKDFSLIIKPGQRVALVGRSGSGKSTVARLVAGLYQPWTGSILFDDIARASLAKSTLSISLSMVEQEIFIFGGTVRDNLTLWDTTITTKQLTVACEDAEIHSMIQEFPGGFEAELLESGANLSGGQRQRLEIARALIHNPTILIFDEATSALDAETERLVMHNLQRRNCTCLIVAHRLSTIRDCDEIIVMDDGDVIQRGTHDELWMNGGLYADLIRAGADEN